MSNKLTEIKKELARESEDFQLTTPRLRKHVYDLIDEVEELRKALEWANRIIGSGLDNGSQLRYDPNAWNMKYHTEWKEQTP